MYNSRSANHSWQIFYDVIPFYLLIIILHWCTLQTEHIPFDLLIILLHWCTLQTEHIPLIYWLSYYTGEHYRRPRAAVSRWAADGQVADDVSGNSSKIPGAGCWTGGLYTVEKAVTKDNNRE